MLINVGPKVNEEDLGAGFYQQDGLPPVKNDPAYSGKLQWLYEECSGRCGAEADLVAQYGGGDITLESPAVPDLPTVISWKKGTAPEFRQDAALVGYAPHNARIELINHFGGGDPNVLKYYAPPKPPQPDGKPSPIGAKWPERGANAYRPSIDNPRAVPYNAGDTYTDASGKYNLTFQWSAFVRVPVWEKVA